MPGVDGVVGRPVDSVVDHSFGPVPETVPGIP
jgi:hypothetical protein